MRVSSFNNTRKYNIRNSYESFYSSSPKGPTCKTASVNEEIRPYNPQILKWLMLRHIIKETHKKERKQY